MLVAPQQSGSGSGKGLLVRAICLILNRRFQPPFIIATPYLDLLIAILDNNAIDLGSIEIDHVPGLPLGFFGAGPLYFEEPEVSDASDRDDRKDEGIPPLHTKRGAATTPSFRSTLAPAA